MSINMRVTEWRRSAIRLTRHLGVRRTAEAGLRSQAGTPLGIRRGHQRSALALQFASFLGVTEPLIVRRQSQVKRSAGRLHRQRGFNYIGVFLGIADLVETIGDVKDRLFFGVRRDYHLRV